MMPDEAVGRAHWADRWADQIVAQRADEATLTCASGITPSGTVHIGNFREIISVELVVRALRDRGRRVRFIVSWDDYDAFRRIPSDLPDAQNYRRYLGLPLSSLPAPGSADSADSYARSNERRLEASLQRLGIEPEYIYQTDCYLAAQYADGIRRALERRDLIRSILDRHREKPLPADWWPVSVFSSFNGKNDTTVLSWDGDWSLTYRCEASGAVERLDLRSTGQVKLLWRIDWPMRWAYEGVDFEPAGKDHHSEGGSFDTAREISRQVYDREPPVSFRYDFVTNKGRGGRLSSSKGEALSVDAALRVYQPEIVRYLFAGTRPNTEFAISFDADVIKIYEDYDRCERIYFGAASVSPKRTTRERRIYELSQIEDCPPTLPPQIQFRHLCNLVQITEGDVDAALSIWRDGSSGMVVPDGELDDDTRRRLIQRVRCAWHWVCDYAPEAFRFHLHSPDQLAALDDTQRRAVAATRALLDRREKFDEETLNRSLYDIARSLLQIEPSELFASLYLALIGKRKGPRLAPFILTVGREKIVEILERY